MLTFPPVAELHLHLYGCIRPKDLLKYISTRQGVRWDWYESEMEGAYGTIPPTRKIVEQYRQGDPTAVDSFEEIFIVGDNDAGNFDRFQAKFNLLIAGSSSDNGPGDLADIEAEVRGFAAAIRADHIRQGISYTEHRVFPGADFETPRNRIVHDILLRDYSAKDSAITRRVAMSLSRSNPWPGWESVQKLALGPYGSALTAIDFCYIEEGYPPKDKADFFAAVRDFNAAHPDRALAILYHVGESFRDKSLESAVRWVQEAAELGAHRLGHAIALGVDPRVFGVHTREESVAERKDQIAYDLSHQDDLRAVGVPVDPHALTEELATIMRVPDTSSITVTYDQERLAQVRLRQRYAMSRVRATGAVIEVCPTSNRRIGAIIDPSHHPIHRFLDAGLSVVVASDDPGIFGTTLGEELDWVCQHSGGGDELRRHLVENAWNSRSEVLTGRLSSTFDTIVE